jgi:hypothetical protein
VHLSHADVDEYDSSIRNPTLSIVAPADGCYAKDLKLDRDQSVAVLPIDGGATRGYTIVDSSKQDEVIGTAKCPDNAPGPSLADLAEASRPEWNMATADVAGPRDSCWPAPAFDEDGNPHPPAELAPWPVTHTKGCPAIGSPFPTYWAAKQCNYTDIRIGYTIYIPNSGFVGGHAHDFEGVDVVWKRNIETGEWARDALLMGRHGNYIRCAPSWTMQCS